MNAAEAIMRRDASHSAFLACSKFYGTRGGASEKGLDLVSCETTSIYANARAQARAIEEMKR